MKCLKCGKEIEEECFGYCDECFSSFEDEEEMFEAMKEGKKHGYAKFLKIKWYHKNGEVEII